MPDGVLRLCNLAEKQRHGWKLSPEGAVIATEVAQMLPVLKSHSEELIYDVPCLSAAEELKSEVLPGTTL